MDKRIVFLCMIICLIFASISCAELSKDNDSLQNELAQIIENLDLKSEEADKLTAELNDAISKLDEANETILDLKDTKYKLVYLGEFKITHYCTMKYKHICGTGNGITATGTQVTAGRSIAVDPREIPYGTNVYITGYGWRVAEDCGDMVKKKHIDIAVETHDEALAMGVKHKDVWILVENP